MTYSVVSIFNNTQLLGDESHVYFCPELWPEEPPLITLKIAVNSVFMSTGSRKVWGEGNPEEHIMVILDNPGAREDCEGNPIVCRTRHSLQKAAINVGLKWMICS
jgi:uracil-DNA glycosylase